MLSIKFLRMKKGLTQLQLAKMTGITNQTISDIERGTVEAPKKETLQKIAEALGVTVDYLHEYERQLKD